MNINITFLIPPLDSATKGFITERISQVSG
jgi:hypothetical protein